MLTAKMGEMREAGGRLRGGGIIAGVVGEQEASWLLLSIVSLYINATHRKALMCYRTQQLIIYTMF